MNIEPTGADDLTPGHGDTLVKAGLPPGSAAGSQFSMARVLLLVVPLGLLILGVLGGKYWVDSVAERRLSLEGLERKIGISNPIQNRLADRFDDAHGNLVADPPKNPKDLLDPEVLTFSYIPSKVAKDEKKVWERWCDDLAKVTGKQR